MTNKEPLTDGEKGRKLHRQLKLSSSRLARASFRLGEVTEANHQTQQEEYPIVLNRYRAALKHHEKVQKNLLDFLDNLTY